MKNLTMNEIHKGSVVKYRNGWMKVRCVFKNGTVNLTNVFGYKTVLKSVPITDLKEDGENWEKDWTNSESYRCM